MTEDAAPGFALGGLAMCGVGICASSVCGSVRVSGRRVEFSRGAYFFQDVFLFLVGIFFVSVVPDHVWCLLLFSLVLLAGF